MSSSGRDLIGNIPMLNQLIDMQWLHRRQFDGILADIESRIASALDGPEAWADQDGDGKNFDDHRRRAQAAFDKMIAATDERASVSPKAGGRAP